MLKIAGQPIFEFDWLNFIWTGIKYEILVHILLFGLVLLVKFMILTCKLIGLKRYTAVSILFDSFRSVRSSIRFPYFRFGPFLFLAILM